MSNQLATLPSLSELVEEYNLKVNGGNKTIEHPDGVVEIIEEYLSVEEQIEAFKNFKMQLQSDLSIGTRYVCSLWESRDEPKLSARGIKARLLQQAWWKVYDGLQVNLIAPTSDVSKIEQMIESASKEFTIENIREVFGKYLIDPWQHLLRGLAEQFAKLDPVYKSHDKMKIGVEGLPKRVIFTYCNEDYPYTNNGSARVLDVMNALARVQNLPLISNGEWTDIMKSARKVDILHNGCLIKRFKNGNLHIFFDTDTLYLINKCLAEFYGEVLADCPEEATEKKSTSTEVAKDLQFYRTPNDVADILLEHAYPCKSYWQKNELIKILEPSCGDGSILDAIERFSQKHEQEIQSFGIEYDVSRVTECRSSGHNAMQGNFLEVEPNPIYDYVLMNPPFYGKHYQKHVEHALKFLKEGGKLYTILPITALTDHKYVKERQVKHLPVGSFSESGTNINTIIACFTACQSNDY